MDVRVEKEKIDEDIPKIEHRSISKALQLRTVSSNQIEGFLPYGSLSVDSGGWREKIARGVFANTLKRGDRVMSLWQHREDQPLGNTDSGTLKLTDSARGLHILIDVPRTSWGRDALESVKRGDVRHFSFGFLPEPEGERWLKHGVREITNARLLKVSPVTWAAYQETCARVRKFNRDSVNKQCSKSITNYCRKRLDYQDRKRRYQLFEDIRVKFLRPEKLEKMKKSA